MTLIALFTVNSAGSFVLQWNLARMRGKFGLFVVLARNCVASTLDYIVIQMRKTNREKEKGYSFGFLGSTTTGASGSARKKTLETTRPQGALFYCFRAFGNLMKHYLSPMHKKQLADVPLLWLWTVYVSRLLQRTRNVARTRSKYTKSRQWRSLKQKIAKPPCWSDSIVEKISVKSKT